MLLRASYTAGSLLRGCAGHGFVRGPCSSSSYPLTNALWSPVSSVSSSHFRKFETIRHLSTSSCRKVPWLPLLAIVGRKSLRVVAMYVGRLIRKQYNALPKDKQRYLREFYQTHKRLVLIGGASLLSVIVLYYASHIERTPITGRLRFITVTHPQLQKLAEVELEQHMALYSNHLLPESDVRVKLVKRTLAQLIRGNEDVPGMNTHDWRIMVVDEPTVSNAFVLPTGHIFFFTGMLDTMKNEEQLGIVLSHEMAHTLLGHGLENMSYTKLLDWIQIVILAALWTVVPSDGIAFITSWFYNLCQQTALHLPFSRKLEIEADAVGLQFAAKACFDVRESYAYWVGMQLEQKAKEEAPVPSILSTHPDHGDRAQRLKALMDDAIALRTLCDCPPFDVRRDPIKRADNLKLYVNQQLALQGKV